MSEAKGSETCEGIRRQRVAVEVSGVSPQLPVLVLRQQWEAVPAPEVSGIRLLRQLLPGRGCANHLETQHEVHARCQCVDCRRGRVVKLRNVAESSWCGTLTGASSASAPPEGVSPRPASRSRSTCRPRANRPRTEPMLQPRSLRRLLHRPFLEHAQQDRQTIDLRQAGYFCVHDAEQLTAAERVKRVRPRIGGFGSIGLRGRVFARASPYAPFVRRRRATRYRYAGSASGGLSVDALRASTRKVA